MNAESPLPPESERRHEKLTEPIAPAISNAELRDDPSRLAEEQAALRRVATLVAQGAPSGEIFSAVAEEVAGLFQTTGAVLRFEEGGQAAVIVGIASVDMPLGFRLVFEEGMGPIEVYRTGHSVRIDHADWSSGDNSLSSLAHLGLVSSVVSPIVVEGRTWGVIGVSSTDDPLPPDTEEQLEKFTELIAGGIANAEAQDALRRVADEQAALRHIATLVAQGASAAELFSAAALEVARVLDVPAVILDRYEGDHTIVLATDGLDDFQVGSEWPLEGPSLAARVLRSGRPERIDDYTDLDSTLASAARRSNVAAAAAAPIVVDGKVWGLMWVGTKHAHALPPDTEWRLASFTELIATAISNAQVRDELRSFANEHAALRRVAMLVAEGTESSRVFEAVCEEAARLVGATGVNLGQFTPEGLSVTVAGWSMTGHHVPAGTRLPLSPDNVSGVIHQARATARKDDYSESTGELATLVRDIGIRSSVGAPVVVEGHVWGALIATTNRDEPLPAGSEARLARFTELIATAIANTQSREALAELAEEQAALRRVATLVAQGVRPSEIFSAVSEEVSLVFQAASAVIRFDEDGPALVFVGVANIDIPLGARWEFEEGMSAAEVYRTGRSVRVENFDWSSGAGPLAATARRIGLVSTVSSPIVTEGRLWGAMAVSSSDEPLPADTEKRLEKFTELVATAIANAESREALSQLATEQAALRRVATLAASESSPVEVLKAVAEEAARVLEVDAIGLLRFEPDETATLVAQSETPWDPPPLGTSFTLEGENIISVGCTERDGPLGWTTGRMHPVRSPPWRMCWVCASPSPLRSSSKGDSGAR